MNTPTATIDTIVTVIVVVSIALLVYTRAKNQTLVDTINEIKEIFTSGKEKAREVVEPQSI